MTQFWQDALKVAGLAAVVSFVFWSLFRAWLSKVGFSKPTRLQSFFLLLAFLVLTFGFALAGFATYAKTHSGNSAVDASIAEQRSQLDDRFERGISFFRQKLEEAKSPEVKTAVNKAAKLYENAYRQARSALDAGQINRFHQSVKEMIEPIMSPDADMFVTPVERHDFIHDMTNNFEAVPNSLGPRKPETLVQ